MKKMCKCGCGEKFETVRTNHVFYSPDCYYKSVLDRSRKVAKGKNGVRKTMEVVACVVCGTKYKTSYKRKTCSDECAIEHKRRKYQARMAEKPKCTQRRGTLIPSTCPLCRKKHMAETAWNYCKLCKAAVVRGFLPDSFDCGRVVGHSRSYGAAL